MPSPEDELGYCIERELVARAEPVIETLRASKLSAVTAESCTGGLVAAILAVCREGRQPVVSRQDFSPSQPDAVRRGAVLHALELLHRSAL